MLLMIRAGNGDGAAADLYSSPGPRQSLPSATDWIDAHEASAAGRQTQQQVLVSSALPYYPYVYPQEMCGQLLYQPPSPSQLQASRSALVRVSLSHPPPLPPYFPPALPSGAVQQESSCAPTSGYTYIAPLPRQKFVNNLISMVKADFKRAQSLTKNTPAKIVNNCCQSTSIPLDVDTGGKQTGDAHETAATVAAAGAVLNGGVSGPSINLR